MHNTVFENSNGVRFIYMYNNVCPAAVCVVEDAMKVITQLCVNNVICQINNLSKCQTGLTI